MTLQPSRLRLTQAIYFGFPPVAVGAGFVRTNGTTPLTAPWNAGQNITAPTFVGSLTGDASLDVRIDGTRALTAGWNAGNFRIDSQNSTRWFNVVAYGADVTGAADSTAAVQAAANAAAAAGGGVVYLPRGLYKVIAGVTITASGVVFEGDRRGGTTVNFLPVGAASAFKFANGVSTINNCAIRGITFKSTDVALTKIAIEIVDAVNFSGEDINISNGWTGTSSIGIKVSGRQSIRLRDIAINSADLPIVIGVNPNFASLSFDHSSIESSELVVTAGLNNPVITISDGLAITNASFRHLALVKGDRGISMNNTTMATASQVIVIDDVRTEQTNGAAGYSIDLRSSSGQIQELYVTNTVLDAGRNGIRLTNAKWPLLKSISYGGTGDFLNLSGTVENLVVLSSFRQTGSTITDASINPTAIDLIVGGNPGVSTFGTLALPSGTPPFSVGSASQFRVTSTGLVGVGSITPTRQIDVAGTQRFRGIAAPAVSEANSMTTYFDSGTNTWKASLNGSAYVDVIGSAGVTGSGVANKLTYWDGLTSLADEPNITLGGTYTLDVAGDINLAAAADVIRVAGAQAIKTDAGNAIVAVGTGVAATPGTSTTIVGTGALALGTGTENTALGANAAPAVTAGTANTAVGSIALQATTGNNNTAVGRGAGATNTTGADNVFLGYGADATAGNLSNAVALGFQASVAASNSMSLGNSSMKVGIRTSTPAQPLDVDGAVAFRHKNIALVNGLNSDIVLTDASLIRLTGPTGGFSIGGFTGGTDGRILRVINTTAQAMTIVNLDASSAAANQITTLTGGNVVLAARTTAATFVYEDVSDTWILFSYNG